MLPKLPGLSFARRAVADVGGDRPQATRAAPPGRLSREDAARWSMGTPENPMVIGALLLFDERVSLEALEESICARLVPHPRFRQRVVEPPHRFARPSWRDEAAFDVHEHVQRLSPASALDGDGLVKLVSDRMSAPLPRDRSPWVLELVDLTPGGSALIARFHHCLADGRALVSLLEELVDGDRAGSRVTSSPFRSPRVSRRRSLLASLGGLVRFFTLPADSAGPLRRPPSGRKRVAWSVSIPMESVKAIARSTGHHVTDILLAGVAGALERHTRASGQAPRVIRALLPVAGPAEPSDDGLGNHYASVFVRLPIAGTAPRTRLESIARDMAAVRRGGELRMALGLMRLAGAVAPLLERWALRWAARRASVVVSSLAGPAAPVDLAQRRLRALVVWAPTAVSIGLSFTFFGYAGALHLGVLADGAVIDRPDELVAGFHAALEELGRGAPRADP